MKLFRGPRYEVETDSKRPWEYIPSWKEGAGIQLNGTKMDRFRAQRTTDLYLKIDEEDVIELFYALIERHQEADAPLDVCVEAMTRLSTTIAMKLQTLEAMRDDVRRLTYPSDKSPDALLYEIREITRRKTRTQPEGTA
jgi:hypothetical protein